MRPFSASPGCCRNGIGSIQPDPAAGRDPAGSLVRYEDGARDVPLGARGTDAAQP